MEKGKISKDFLSKVNAIKAHSLGKNKNEIDSRIEYTAISVWLIDCSRDLGKSEKEYLQKLKTEYEERYIGSDIIGDAFKKAHENPTVENLQKLLPYSAIFDAFNRELKLYEYEGDITSENDKKGYDDVTDKTDEKPVRLDETQQ